MITEEFIEREMIDFFNPFAYNAVKYDLSEGGFDVQLVEDHKLRFVIFDLEWENPNKEEIWSHIVDCEGITNPTQLKLKCAQIIEPLILAFCQS